MKEGLRKETMLRHHRRDLVVVGVLAVGISVALLYALGVGRGDDTRVDVEQAKEWREAVAGAAQADEAAAKLASRTVQDEADRRERVVRKVKGPLAPEGPSAESAAALARCMKATTSLSLMKRLAKGAAAKGKSNSKAQRVLAKQTEAHLEAARELCAVTVDSQKFCLSVANNAEEIAACSGAKLSPEQQAIFQRAAQAIAKAEPELGEDGSDPTGKAAFRGKADSSYQAILADVLSELPEGDRAKARKLVDGAMREHVNDR